MDNDNDNVIKGPFGVIEGDKKEADGEGDSIPENDYVFVNQLDEVFTSHGFLIFTPHHAAIMRDVEGKGAIPVLVMPLPNVKIAQIAEDYDADQEAATLVPELI